MAYITRFEDEGKVFENSGFDPNKTVFDGNESLAQKILSLDEKQFCSFNKQLSLLPEQRGNDFIGQSFAPPITVVDKKKLTSKSTLSGSNLAKEERKRKLREAYRKSKTWYPCCIHVCPYT